MKKNEKNPGLLNDANQIKDRVITTVSNADRITLSEPRRVYGRLFRSETGPGTAHAILREEKKNRPTNEDSIRGLN